MRDGRDAVTGCRTDPLLRAQEAERAHRRVDRLRAERPRELTEALRDQAVEVDVLIHVVLVRSDVAAGIVGADPHAVQLCDLLRQRHPLDEAVDIRLRRHRREGLYALFHGHPFTAPVSPPTMRFSARRKNASAGIIAREV